MLGYYTYMLVDPRNNLPFYVGKGTGRRCYQHLTEARSGRNNSHKCNVIRKILSLGMEPVIKVVDSGLTEAVAFELEEFLIQELGRHDKSSGHLTNKTNGGEGASGAIRTHEMKRKISAFVTENNPMHRDEVRLKTSGKNHWNYGQPAANLGMKWTDEQRAAQSKRFSGEHHNLFGKPCSEARKAAIKAATTGVKKSTTINMRKPRSKVECPHCGKVGGSNTMHRWHMDNCKEKAAC
jgi:hypothetical protein